MVFLCDSWVVSMNVVSVVGIIIANCFVVVGVGERKRWSVVSCWFGGCLALQYAYQFSRSMEMVVLSSSTVHERVLV